MSEDHCKDWAYNYTCCKLKGKFPALSSQLQYLYVHNCGFSGSVDEMLSRADNAVLFRLVGLQVSGTIPPKRAASLATIFGGFVSGTLPVQALDSLFFNLESSTVSGSMPFGFFNATTNLLGKYLGPTYRALKSNTRLSGTVQTPSPNSSMYTLQIYDSPRISGTVPNMNCRTSDYIKKKWTELGLEFLQLYELNLSGSSPDTISALSQLQFLLLRKSSLSGSVHPDMSMLTGLVDLQISSTKNSGSIPSEFRSLTMMVSLMVSSSKLHMDLNMLGYWPEIQSVMASKSEQAGIIAPNIILPDTFQYLLLEGCKLSGTLSSELFESNLTTIDVSSNLGISGQASQHTETQPIEIC